MSNNNAVIFGANGQDGSWMSELLVEKGYEVIGTHRRSSINNTSRRKKTMSNVKLFCDDCLNVTGNIPDNSIDCIIIDPPYMVHNVKWDKRDIFDDIIIKELYRVANDKCNICVWCGIGEKSQSLMRWFPRLNKYFYFKDLITWKKQRGIGMRKGWLYTREEILWFVKNNKSFIWNKDYQYSTETYDESWIKRLKKEAFPYKRATNVWIDIKEETLKGVCGIKNISKKKLKHLTPKPLKAIERLICVHTNENDVVLDCFMGSGSTGVVCKMLNRSFIGVEIDKDYFNIAKERIEQAQI